MMSHRLKRKLTYGDWCVASKEEKPLKPFRSQAEKHAIHQRNIQIALTATNVLVACLTCLRVFGVI
jgi:hypothetical protein